MKVLVDNKADLNVQDPDGVSPLLVAIMNANWDLAKQLIEAGADVNEWDMYGEAPLFTAVGERTKANGGHASIDPLNETNGLAIVRMLLDHGANPNMQLFFRPANVRGSTNTRGSTPLIRAAKNVGTEASTPCPICDEDQLRLVTYVFGPRLPAHGKCVTTAKELRALDRRNDELSAYLVEACVACHWHHLRSVLPVGGS